MLNINIPSTGRNNQVLKLRYAPARLTSTTSIEERNRPMFLCRVLPLTSLEEHNKAPRAKAIPNAKLPDWTPIIIGKVMADPRSKALERSVLFKNARKLK